VISLALVCKLKSTPGALRAWKLSETRVSDVDCAARKKAIEIESTGRLWEKGARKNEEGPRLGSRALKGRAPLIRPRRDRIMGSSILASLSEAGGNDPFHSVLGPLPPQVPNGADRVGTRPTPSHMQVKCLLSGLRREPGSPFIKALAAWAHLGGAQALDSQFNSGIAVPHWRGTSSPRCPSSLITWLSPCFFESSAPSFGKVRGE